MCRCRLTELNCVRTKMRFKPEWMQLDTGISMSRYFPAIGTAGLLRDLVSGNRRVPRPPPRISETTRGMKPLLRLCCGERPSIRDGDNHQHVLSLCLSHFIVHDRKDDGERAGAAAGTSTAARSVRNWEITSRATCSTRRPSGPRQDRYRLPACTTARHATCRRPPGPDNRELSGMGRNRPECPAASSRSPRRREDGGSRGESPRPDNS